jgi:hypothetical protein
VCQPAQRVKLPASAINGFARAAAGVHSLAVAVACSVPSPLQAPSLIAEEDAIALNQLLLL